MSLRVDIFNIITDNLNQNKNLETISALIYDYLDNEGLGIYGNGWADDPSNLKDIMEAVNDPSQIMFSAARILYSLDINGLGLSNNGWFDNDAEWEQYEDVIFNFERRKEQRVS